MISRFPRETLFQISVWLKGLNAALEVMAGGALLFVTPGVILGVVTFFAQDELAEDPHDRVANVLLGFAQHLSVGTERFIALYLLSHGVTKFALVVALLRRILWAYPVSAAVFAAFVAYQLYRYSFTHSAALLALSLFDLTLICLIWAEFVALRKRPRLRC